MALPLIPLAVASGISWGAAKVDSLFNNDEQKSTGASVGKVVLYGVAIVGAIVVYKEVKKRL